MMRVWHPELKPSLTLLEPEITLGLPAALTAWTGIDAMVHAIEAYTSALRKNPLSDLLARQAPSLRTLMGGSIALLYGRGYRLMAALVSRSPGKSSGSKRASGGAAHHRLCCQSCGTSLARRRRSRSGSGRLLYTVFSYWRRVPSYVYGGVLV